MIRLVIYKHVIYVGQPRLLFDLKINAKMAGKQIVIVIYYLNFIF